MISETLTNDDTRTKPPIVLSTEDYERLAALASAAMNVMPDLASELADEIRRAEVLDAGQCADQVVCMNSEVEFRDDASGRARKVTLVYPEDADIAQNRISVLTPVGTALIGIRVGESMTWETPAGDVRRLTVLSVAPVERHP